MNDSSKQAGNDVFLTGATGNLGSRLLAEYLTRTDREVWVLVRAASQEEAQRRVDHVLDFWRVALHLRARVHVVPGDILEPGLGIDPDTWDTLTRRIRWAIHAASNLRLDLPLEQARREIVGGTKNVYALAKSCAGLERFGYCSTQEIMGRYPGVIREEFLTHHDIPFINTYERAKFECEEMLREEIEAGVPISVFRFSMLVGEASTGRVLRFQSFYLLIEKLLIAPEHRLLPSGAPLDTVPVDFLAAAIRRLMEAPCAAGRIHHLSLGDEDAVDFDRLSTKVRRTAERRLGRPSPRCVLVPSGAYRRVLSLLARVPSKRARRYFETQLVFLSFFDLPGRFTNTATRSELEKLGMSWPRFDDYLPRLLDYYFDHRAEVRMPF